MCGLLMRAGDGGRKRAPPSLAPLSCGSSPLPLLACVSDLRGFL